MNDVSNLQDPPKNTRPRVSSIKVKTKGVSGNYSEEVITISYYTEELDYAYYQDSLPSISAITISNIMGSVTIPRPSEEFFPTFPEDGKQGFGQFISAEKKGELLALVIESGHITINITFETENIPMSFE